MTVLAGQLVSLEPLRPAHAELLRRLHSTPEVLRWWGPMDPEFPESDDPEAVRFAIVAGGEVVGMVQYGEEPEPDYRHAWIDIFVGPRHRGRGYGTDALQRLVEHLIAERGHHRVTIDPALENGAAVASYAKAGFQPVGVMRSAWLDRAAGSWRDVLFMEIVAGSAGAAPAGARAQPAA